MPDSRESARREATEVAELLGRIQTMTLTTSADVQRVEAWLRDSTSSAVRLAALRKLQTAGSGASPGLLEALVRRSPLAGEAGVPALAAFASLARDSDPAIRRRAIQLAEEETDRERKSILAAGLALR